MQEHAQWPKPAEEFPFSVFWTIKIGTLGNAKAYLDLLGERPSEGVRKFLKSPRADEQIKCAQKEMEVDLVSVSVGELGFEEACTSEIHARGKEKWNLELCLPEDALALGLSPWSSVVETSYVMAMHVLVPDGPRAFMFERGKLVFVQAGPFNIWLRNERFIFRKPR